MELHERFMVGIVILLGLASLWFSALNIGSAVLVFQNVENRIVSIAFTIIPCLLSVPSNLMYVLLGDYDFKIEWHTKTLYPFILVPIINLGSIISLVTKLFLEICTGTQGGKIDECGINSSVAGAAFGMLFFAIAYSLWVVFILWGITDSIGVKHSMEKMTIAWAVGVAETLLLLYGIGMLTFGLYYLYNPLKIGGAVVVSLAGAYILALIIVSIWKRCFR